MWNLKIVALLHRLSLAMSLIVVSSCQTSRPDFIAPELPTRLSQLFGSCSGDGASRLVVYRGGRPSESSVIDWLVQNDGSWIAQATTPMGSVLFELRYDREAQSIIAKGAIQNRLALGVSESGYLKVEGHEVHLRLDELPCFMKNRFPKAWLDSVVSSEVSPNRLRLNVWQKDRRLLLDLSLRDNASEHCARVSWTNFLGFVERRVLICKEQSKIVMSGWEDSRLEIEYMEGQ